MGRNKKGFNWKARQKNEIKILNDNNTPKVEATLYSRQDGYDEANALVLPSKKRLTKKIVQNKQPTRILSKKQRKRLEKVVQKKQKKKESVELLAKLYEANIQPSSYDFGKFTSIASAQTKGRKRMLIEKFPAPLEDNSNDFNNHMPGVCLKKRRRSEPLPTVALPSSSENLVAFDQPSSDSESESGSLGEKSAPSGHSSFSNSVPNNNKDIHLISDSSGTPSLEVEHRPIIVCEITAKSDSDVKVTSIDKIKLEKVDQPGESKKKEQAVWVPVERSDAIEKVRRKLPIIAEEHNIMELVREHDVVIVAGETGSGKTTQVPQFLYEAGFTRNGKIIGVTQPRRVAAISMSSRVAHELNLSSDVVSYVIRFEGNVTDKSEIKFMTDGVLLKEMQSDFTLSKYSAVILDEAHERNTYTDILIGLLSRVVPLRRKRGHPLKLIIMSATLRVEDFTQNSRLFKTPPPVLRVDARQFPVSVHFSRRTAQDYLTEAFRKVCKIHSQLPDGGVLVFVTGQQEVKTLVRRLRARFPTASDGATSATATAPAKRSRRSQRPLPLPDIDLNTYGVTPTDDTEGDRLEDVDDEDIFDEDFDDLDGLPDDGESSQPMWVVPFYSLLPPSEQAKIFKPPPAGCRFCVVSTNVAETSLTIPGIRYVVDTGKTKTRLYDKLTGVSTFRVTWCSKASANQRAGRAGRLGPGHCYRLYSSAVFNEFEQFGEPEVRQKPVDALVLLMKALNIVKVANFPFPTPPDSVQLAMAESRLLQLGALDPPSTKDGVTAGRLTPLGRTMAAFPVAPRYGKMLALGHQHGLLPYVVTIVAALSVPEMLLDVEGDKRLAAMRRAWAGTANSFLLGDAMVLLRAVGAAECSKEPLEQFCAKHGLRHKAMVEIRKLRVQLTAQLNLHVPGLSLVADPNMAPPTDTQARLLRQIVLSGLLDQVARKMDPNTLKETDDKIKWKRAYKSTEIEEPIVMRITSVLSRQLPEWVVYQEAYESNKLYMRGVTAIEPEWLALVAPRQCNLSEPSEEPPPRYDADSGTVMATVSGTYGRAALEIPAMEVSYTSSIFSYKWFARFLLQGEVFPKLQRFVPALLSSPSIMVKSWSKLQTRTEVLLNALLSKEANTKQKLIQTWEDEPAYLMSAYQKWLPESAHAQLASLWPPI